MARWSRFPRTVPTSQAVLSAYANYQFERADILGDVDCDMVCVEAGRPPLTATSQLVVMSDGLLVQLRAYCAALSAVLHRRKRLCEGGAGLLSRDYGLGLDSNAVLTVRTFL